MLNTTPIKAETAATIPTPDGSAPRWVANRGSTGLFDIVELNIAKSPVLQSMTKGLNFIIASTDLEPLSHFLHETLDFLVVADSELNSGTLQYF
jgi:hypothetical protein